MSSKGRGRLKKAFLPPDTHGNTSSQDGKEMERNNPGSEVHTKKVTQTETPGTVVKDDQVKQKQVEDVPKKLWVNVISGNRNPSNGMKMDFVAPKIVNKEIEIEIVEDDIVSELCYCESALIMYVLG